VADQGIITAHAIVALSGLEVAGGAVSTNFDIAARVIHHSVMNKASLATILSEQRIHLVSAIATADGRSVLHKARRFNSYTRHVNYASVDGCYWLLWCLLEIARVVGMDFQAVAEAAVSSKRGDFTLLVGATLPVTAVVLLVGTRTRHALVHKESFLADTEMFKPVADTLGTKSTNLVARYRLVACVVGRLDRLVANLFFLTEVKNITEIVTAHGIVLAPGNHSFL